jgi:mono/diheme cytochrome c family protein
MLRRKDRYMFKHQLLLLPLFCLVALQAGACARDSTGFSESAGGGPRLDLDAKATLGRKVFLVDAAPVCSQCHTLKEAGAAAKIGANLDELQPDIERVRQAVLYGSGIMPPQGDRLTPEQIEAVAYYVTVVAGMLD